MWKTRSTLEIEFDSPRSVLDGLVNFVTEATVSQGGTGIGKKDPGSIFFLRASAVGLTNYVIRNMSIYSNMTS